MFIYLSKKIAIPNNTKLNCLGWNRSEGYIACGGDEGLLKVLKLDSGKDGNLRGLAAPSNLSMNQSLEGHKGQIQVVTWNEIHQKLTTSDQSGLIIVWMLYKGSWYEEMINNRNKSMVRGMSWNSDGQKICIVYEDGAVIVGSVDGSRIWSKELKNVFLTNVVWSPDSKLLLFALGTGEVHAYDNQGSFTMRLSIECLPNPNQQMTVVGLDWYNGRNGWFEERCPALAICYRNGCLQLMRAETDDASVIVDTGMTVSCCYWNHDGSLLAIAGTAQLLGEDHDSNVVQFFNPYGQHIRTLKVPGQEVTACAWDGASLRLALAVDSYIYFANIRPDYRWTYFESTVVYAYTTSERIGTQVAFWDTRNHDECYVRNVRSLYAIASWGEHCVLATRASEQDFSPASSSASPNPIDSAADRGQFNLILCNAISTAVDSKSIDLEPLWVAINSSHVVAASKDNFLLWHYRSPRTRTTIATGKLNRKVRIYHVDDTPSGVTEVLNDLDRSYEPATSLQATADPICCLEISDRILLIGRESGIVQRYSIPQLALTHRYSLDARPLKLAINCNSTRLAVISLTGILSFLDLEGANNTTVRSSSINSTQRKDVWSMRWASDNADLIAVMEKTRMYILRGNDPEEPLFTSGYICSFKELEVRVALLDELMQHPEKPVAADYLNDLEVKSLRDTRNLLEKVGLSEATAFVQENPHPRLWRLIAEAAVKELDLEAAEMAFVRCSDYPGVQLVRRLRGLHSEALRRAQIAAWFGKYEQAENLYLEADRRDLAIALREKLGDCYQVLQLMRTGGTGVATDAQKAKAYNSLGQQLADKHDWKGAREYFEKSGNESMLIQCYNHLEDFEALEKSATSLPENHPLLPTIAEMFLSVAMCSQAVDAYLKCGEMKFAVDACVALNQWDQAIELAKHYKLPEINDLLIRYGEHLLEKNSILEAVALYKKAGRLLEAAKLLYQLAYKERDKGVSSPLRLKKIHVLAALLIEQHGRSKLLGVDALADMAPWLKDNAWRGAEAYHFLLLAHRQLYSGDLDAAMKSSLHLTQFDDLLNPEDIYALQALTACANKSFSFCNKAFIKLEAIEEMDPIKKTEYEALALDIFTKYSTKDTGMTRSECKNCETMIPDCSPICPSCELHFPISIATGRPLMDPTIIWTCPQCRHSAAEQEILMQKSCPLCHVNLSQ